MQNRKPAAGEALPKKSPISFLLDAFEMLGGPVQAMVLLNLTPQAFMNLAGGITLPDRQLAEKIEGLTYGRVTAAQLYPDNDFEAAFLEFQKAHARAAEIPCVRNWRAAVIACDKLQLIADQQ